MTIYMCVIKRIILRYICQICHKGKNVVYLMVRISSTTGSAKFSVLIDLSHFGLVLSCQRLSYGKKRC